VRSSMDAARASGMVPGMRFATVNPTPPSMKLRREMFDLVLVSSLRYFLLECATGAASDHGSGLRYLLEKFSLSPIAELIVGWRVAIRNTIRLRRTIGHAAWRSRETGGDDLIE
jgi:hypothetical protein